MKTAFSGVWFRAARYAAAVALLCGSQISWGEDKAPAAPAAEPAAFQTSGQSDDIFDQYASTARLAAAWRNLDSVGMTDAALQFAEGERVLLRSHSSIKASQVLDLAIRVATEKGDKDSLGRLAKALERSGDKERLAQVNVALKTAGTSRAVDPELAGGDVNIRNVVQDVQVEIRSARVAENAEQLKALSQTLADLPISDQQKTALNKEIAETTEALGDNQELANATELLDRVGGVVRPVAEIKEPSGGTFVMPDFSKDEIPVKEQIAFFNQQIAQMNESSGLQLGGIGRQEDALAKLSLPSRSSNTGWTDQSPNGGSGEYAYNAYGVGSIYQYCNLAGRWQDKNCGQAAVATLLTYHGKYPQSSDGKLQTILEAKYPPDLFWGAAGTSPARVMSCANNYGLNCNQGLLQSNMEPWIRNRYPCVIVVDVGKAGGGWTGRSGLHYIVVYAYDSKSYWCTNWAGSAKVPKSTILKCWSLGGWFFAATPK